MSVEDKRSRKVKNVTNFLRGFDENTVHAIHQFLEWFRVDKRLETIAWALLKRKQVAAQRHAERFVSNRRLNRASSRKPPGERRGIAPSEPLPMRPLRICDCGGLVTGEPLPGCAARESGRSFYQECDTCGYWEELIVIGKNKFTSRRGG